MSSANPLFPQGMSVDDFLNWERTTKDTLDFKRIYVDIAGDLIAGLALSEIVYWRLPNKNGDSKLSIYHRGHYWIASTRYEWWSRVRITPKQIDRALNILREKQLIETDIFKFKGEPTIHIRLLMNPFMMQLAEVVDHPVQNPFLSKQAKPFSPKSDSPIAYKELMNSLEEASPVTEGIALGIGIKSIACRQILDGANNLPINAENKTQSSADNPPIPAGKNPPSSSETEGIALSPGNDGIENNKEIDYAIRDVWNTKSPDRVEKLRKTLLGQHPHDSEFYICNVEPPATANEIRQMGEYFARQYPGESMHVPTMPEKIQDWLYKSREKQIAWVTYKNYLINTRVRFPTDLFGGYEGLVGFLQRYHPNEYALFLKEVEYIDTKLQPVVVSMILRPHIPYRGYEFDLPNPLPSDVFYSNDMVEILKYLETTNSAIYTALQNSIRNVDQKLAEQP